ncbi:MAG TPA: hypothetical protein VD908_00660 [Cytophagales bacterium]|nr:hypothetical protein [Cytophagales bacterium]
MTNILLFQFVEVEEGLTETAKSVYSIFKLISFIALSASVVNLVILMGILLFTKNPKTKYDFINKHEIPFLWRSSLLLIISAAFIINTLFVNIQPVWIGVRVFVTIMMGLIFGLSIFNILKFYYPFYIEKRLKKLRFKRRISAKSGKPMTLLSEEEEDAYLDEGMQVEENIFSMDYDVWYCNESGDVYIEKYFGHLTAEKCPSCDYQTYKIIKEEIVEKPSMERDGVIGKHYKCSYCGHRSIKEQPLKLSGRLNNILKDKITNPEFTPVEKQRVV